MKKIIFGSLVSFFSLTSNTQAQVSKTNQHLKVFNQALATGDLNTGIIALNYYISEPGANPVYEDSLAMMYMQTNSFAQCYYWANKRLNVTPENLTLMELKAICLDKLQQPKEAIAIFEKLYSKTKSPFHAYKLMELQYSIKRLVECLATAISSEKLEFKPEYVVSYSIGDEVGRTYLQAGIFNIQGLTYYELDRKAEAKLYFEKAVGLDSNFVLAKQNLEAMKTLANESNKVNPNNNTVPVSPANKQ